MVNPSDSSNLIDKILPSSFGLAQNLDGHKATTTEFCLVHGAKASFTQFVLESASHLSDVRVRVPYWHEIIVTLQKVFYIVIH
ncbi:hypothetical protein RchiOBHm_Chr5g0047661 [Rosa chinensis]|uniref:Uncharacterized protein n=1 Tax=Rosa chinensis TaxID=74649 RepID=A0A2P6QEE2_ROSCH|nr:hypothetical protein RchiOBHm_Chr5g0047661 [Rosa chinensis]